MKKFLTFFIAIIAYIAFAAGMAGAAEFLVLTNEKVPDGVAAQSLHSTAAAVEMKFRTLIARSGVKAQKITPLPYIGIIIVETDDADAVKTLSATDGVQSVSRSRSVHIYADAPTDPGFAQQWYHAPIGTLSAWDSGNGDADFIVAVFDTGVDYNHEELKNRMHTEGYTAFGTSWMDVHGHGTHVSGIIAATVHNGKGGAGIAPNVKIMPVKILNDSGSGSSAQIAQGINYVVGKKKGGANIRLANFSLGTGPTTYYDTVEYAAYKALSEAGVLILAAAGNDNNNNDNMSVYPANYNLPNQITVGATDNYGTNSANAKRASWGSNYGKTKVQIFAPGTSIYSSIPGDKYAPWNGTSMATPVAVGVAALAWSTNPSLNAWDVKKAVLETGTKASELSQLCSTGMVVNAQAAVARAQSMTPTPTNPDNPVDPKPNPNPDPDDPIDSDYHPVPPGIAYAGNGLSVTLKGNTLVYNTRINGDRGNYTDLLYENDLNSSYQIGTDNFTHDRFEIRAYFHSSAGRVTVEFEEGFMMSDTTYWWSVPLWNADLHSWSYLPIRITRKADWSIFGTDSGCNAGIVSLALLLPLVLLKKGKSRK